jgi:hypothetical protein
MTYARFNVPKGDDIDTRISKTAYASVSNLTFFDILEYSLHTLSDVSFVLEAVGKWRWQVSALRRKYVIKSRTICILHYQGKLGV